MKRLFGFLTGILLVSLACQTPADNTHPTRVAIVETAQPYFATPQNWENIPKKCFESLTQVSYGIEAKGTGSVIEIDTLPWSDGKNYYVYYILTVDHLISDHSITTGSDLAISAGFTARLDYHYKVADATKIYSDEGIGLDGAFVAIVGDSLAITELGEAPIPISTSNITPGTDLPKDGIYYAFGYPQGSWYPQFIQAKVVDSFKDPIFLYTKITLEKTDLSPSISVEGYSGGPVCSEHGQIVGVMASYDGNIKQMFATPMPNNIAMQYSDFKNKVKQDLHIP